MKIKQPVSTTLGTLILAVFCASCANFTSPARKHELEQTKSYWLDYDATRRGAIITPQPNKFSVCAEPSPDVALEMVDKFLLKLGYGKFLRMRKQTSA